MEDTNWGSRGRRTSGNLKPRRLDEEKLAFLREAYEPDEEHLVAEALFDLANMFEEEDDAVEGQDASFQQQHQAHASPPLNGKRTRKGLPATSQQQQQQQPKPMTRTYSQQRASPLPHNMVTHPAGGAAAAAAAAANSMQQSLLLAQQQLHQLHPQPQQQHPQHASVGQAAQASTHPQAAGLYPSQQSFFTAGAGGLQGTNPFFMPPYSHLQLPPGALSGKLATTLLPNGNPVPLAFGPNGTLMPLSGAWPQGLLHPQQRQQHHAALAQQLQSPLGLAAHSPSSPANIAVSTGLVLPLGAAQVSVAQQQQQQQQQQPLEQGTGEDDDDDEAPQEVTLASSRAQAKHVAQQQRQTRTQAAQQAKAQRREAEMKRRELREQQERQKRAGSSKRGREQAVAEEGQQGGGASGSGYALEEDLLPQEVLDQLQQPRSSEPAATYVPAPSKQQAKQIKKRKKLEQLKKGPVTVSVLSAVNKMASGTASSFLKEQLYSSSRVNRSFDMVKPKRAKTSAQGGIVGPAARFV